MTVAYIALDAGHGSNTYDDKGSKGIVMDNGKVFEEHEFNATVVKYAKELAEHNDFKILLTQPLFKPEVPLIERTDLANREEVDIFVSVHGNASGSPNATGACCFYWHTAEGSKKLANIWTKYAKNTPVGLHGDGLHEAKRNSWTNLHICRETWMTAILIEHGFFTTDTDLQKMLSDDYRKLCAENIVRSLCEYYGVEFKPLNKKVEVVNTKTLGSVVEKVDSVQLEEWQVKLAHKAIENLGAKQNTNGDGKLINDVDKWKQKVKENPEEIIRDFPWLLFVMLDRVSGK